MAGAQGAVRKGFYAAGAQTRCLRETSGGADGEGIGDGASVKRHFTATGFVVDGSRTLLHWHRRLGQWMPPGGHIEANEDPVQAVLREISEQTGITAEIINV